MKLNCGPSWQEYQKQQAEWHPFFAIWPRRVGESDCRCFEWIERKRKYCSWSLDAHWITDYRAKK